MAKYWKKNGSSESTKDNKGDGGKSEKRAKLAISLSKMRNKRYGEKDGK